MLTYRRDGEKEGMDMTAKDFYEWVKEWGAEDFQMEIVHDDKNAHLCEVDEEKKKVILYTA